MKRLELDINKTHCIDCLQGLKKMETGSVDLIVTSPPYYNLRDYGVDGQIGLEETVDEYIDRLIEVFNECYRVLNDMGSCWVNIGDTYSKNIKQGAKKSSLLCIPDKFKVAMISNGWICRNEIIWHKPNAMPSSAKTRFNTDYEKMYFFTKSDVYKFNTQYEEAKTQKRLSKSNNKDTKSKYISDEQEKSVRQGMSKSRGSKIIEVRPMLPPQDIFVTFLRNRIKLKDLINIAGGKIKKTTIEHWFRRDLKGFSYPTLEDWNYIKNYLGEKDDEFITIDKGLSYITYETDAIDKNIDKGRIKRCVWSINTKPFKGGHFAPYPEELILTPILACSNEGDLVMDIFSGSGTTHKVAKMNNRNFIGFELNSDYIKVEKERLKDMV